MIESPRSFGWKHFFFCCWVQLRRLFYTKNEWLNGYLHSRIMVICNLYLGDYDRYQEKVKLKNCCVYLEQFLLIPNFTWIDAFKRYTLWKNCILDRIPRDRWRVHGLVLQQPRAFSAQLYYCVYLSNRFIDNLNQTQTILNKCGNIFKLKLFVVFSIVS